MTETRDRIKVVEQLRPFFSNEAGYGRMHANLHDLVEASEWFLATMDRTRAETLTAEQVEDFLIELEVHFVDHAMFHLRSLKKDIAAVLATFPDDAGDGSGAAA
jgi:hypothetical protein